MTDTTHTEYTLRCRRERCRLYPIADGRVVVRP